MYTLVASSPILTLRTWCLQSLSHFPSLRVGRQL